MTPDYEQGWREGATALFRELIATDSGGFIPASAGIKDKDGNAEDWLPVGFVFSSFEKVKAPRPPILRTEGGLPMTDREALAQITATLEKVKADAIENDWRLHRQTLLDVQGAIKAAAGVHLGDEGLRKRIEAGGASPAVAARVEQLLQPDSGTVVPPDLTERLARARNDMIDGIATDLSCEFAQGDPFEPFDRTYVLKRITAVLDAARKRTAVAAALATSAEGEDR